MAVLSSYHAALEAGDTARVVALLGPTFVVADERTGERPDRLRAHMFLSGRKLRAWPEAFLAEVGPYRNEFVVVSASVRGDAAVVLTRDTGSNAFRAWTDEEVSWFLGRIAGRWRIAAQIIRDIQLPDERPS